MTLMQVILPELILVAVAAALFLLGISSRAAARKLAGALATVALLVVFAVQLTSSDPSARTMADEFGAFRVGPFAQFIKLLSAGVGVLLVLLAWPSDREATGNSALVLGRDAGEFFGLLLLSIAGIFLVAGANDMILLFLGLELASIPTYIMVSVSRRRAIAQEAGVKYFFLGALSAAVMLFAFSYLYGTTGSIDLRQIAQQLAAQAPGATAPPTLTSWQLLAAVMLIAAFAFKIAAVPLHFYAADVYQGAATPVTALLSFVPKTAGFVALIKLLHVISGGNWNMPPVIAQLLWVLAVLTMSVGNVLGLMQTNVKRVLAYSSIAHSGYMLVGLTALALGRPAEALQGVVFYLSAYGIMNVGAFGVLMLIPARNAAADDRLDCSAETFEDIAGAGRRNAGLGLAMAVACFSLIGLPLTVGFFGKIYLIRPALSSQSYWLVVIMVVNAGISAAYYLKIVGTMFLRDERPAAAFNEAGVDAAGLPVIRNMPVLVSVALSCAGTLLFGAVLPGTEVLLTRATQASYVDDVIVPAAAEEPAQP